MTERRGLIVADDLSGASDTGHQLAACGYPTAVVAGDEASSEDGSVVVVDTDSRYREPDEAARRVARAVTARPAPVVYKKVDSTLRGNLVPEIEAVLDATGSRLAVFAPAFPATGRITVGGTHVVDGTPVAMTAAGRDPDAPVTTSDVAARIDGGDFAVERLSLAVVADGPTAVERRLRSLADRDDRTVVACDAAVPAHLEAVAVAADRVDARVTYVGSGGLARHVRFGSGRGGVLGVAGSANPATFAQLSTLDDAVVVDVDAPRAVANPDAAVERATDRAATVLETREEAVIASARTAEDVDATLAAGAEAGLTDAETRDRVASALARTARGVHDRVALGGLFVTGGAVARATLDALDGNWVRLTGHAVADGVPVGRITGGAADGVPLVTKAGDFGDADAIVKSLRRLSRYDDGP